MSKYVIQGEILYDRAPRNFLEEKGSPKIGCINGFKVLRFARAYCAFTTHKPEMEKNSVFQALQRDLFSSSAGSQNTARRTGSVLNTKQPGPLSI